MENKKVKVTNPYNCNAGLRLMDGLREIIVYGKSFVLLDAEEIYYINNMSSIFTNRKLLVEDDEVNRQLGILDDSDSVVSMSDDEIEKLLKGNIMTMKKALSDIKDKHVIDRIVDIAKTVDDLAQGKLKILQEVSGYDFEQLIKSE